MTKQKVPKLRFPEFTGEWEEKKLGEIGVIISGLTYSPINVNENGILVLRSSNIQKRNLKFKDNVYVDKNDFNPVKENDILICVRNGSKNLIGKSALITKEVEGVAFGAFMSIFRSSMNKFLFQFFDTKFYKKTVYKNLGATINSINNSDLKKFKLSFPSLPEQEKIADFLTLFDKEIELEEKKLDLLKENKKGYMQKIFSQELRFKDEFGNDYPQWEEKRLEKLFNFFKGQGLPKSQIEKDGKYKCIHYGELFIKYKEQIKVIRSFTNNNNDKCCFSRKNDILMPTSDVTPNGLATASCVNEDDIILGGDILIIRSKLTNVSGLFFSYYISNNKKDIMKIVSGTTVYHLYASDLKKLKIQLPSLPEQEKIANFLSTADEEIELMENKIEKLKEIKKGLLQQMFI